MVGMLFKFNNKLFKNKLFINKPQLKKNRSKKTVCIEAVNYIVSYIYLFFYKIQNMLYSGCLRKTTIIPKPPTLYLEN